MTDMSGYLSPNVYDGKRPMTGAALEAATERARAFLHRYRQELDHGWYASYREEVEEAHRREQALMQAAWDRVMAELKAKNLLII